MKSGRGIHGSESFAIDIAPHGHHFNDRACATFCTLDAQYHCLWFFVGVLGFLRFGVRTLVHDASHDREEILNSHYRQTLQTCQTTNVSRSGEVLRL